MNILWLDYETRSRCDLPSRGGYNYAQDPSTEILCMAYAINDEEVALWTPDQPFPQAIVKHINAGGQIRAHNAGFDRLITEFVLCPDFGVPTPRLEQWYCTAAQARANCAPGSLEDVGRFASSSMKKDHRGKQLIRLLCIPLRTSVTRRPKAGTIAWPLTIACRVASGSLAHLRVKLWT